MKYSSIQVTPVTRRRIARYKRGGLTYEDVLRVLMDAIPPEEFHARKTQAQRAASEQIAAIGRRDPAAAAIEGRERESARILSLSPGERMEEAYRISTLLRGPP